MRSGPWILALGALAIGLAAGALVGARLGGEGTEAEAVGANAPAPSEEVAPADPAPSPTAAVPKEPERESIRADAGAPPVPAPSAVPAVSSLPSSLQQPIPAPLPEIRSPGEEQDERRWRERTVAVRDRLVAAYETCLAHAQTPYKYVIGGGRVTQIIDASAFAQAKAELLTTQSSLRFLQEDARRAGVPPGWVRVDWSGYSRNPNPENGVCERTLPEELSPR